MSAAPRKKNPPRKYLPAAPNLEHLRKQAKALLRAFRKKEPRVVAKFRALELKTTPKLSTAQHLIAREYGFDTWTKLKEHVDAEAAQMKEAFRLAWKALRDDNASEFRRLLKHYPGLKATINEPVGDVDLPLINAFVSKA